MDNDSSSDDYPYEDYNLGTITVKVKLFDDYHDIVLNWSEQSEGYERKQIFNQLATITGIPSNFTTDVKIGGEEADDERELQINNPEAEVNKNTRADWFIDPLCNEFVRELAQSLERFENDYYILIFRMWLEEDKHFYIYYELFPHVLAPETQCSGLVCLYAHTPVIFDKFRSLILSDELYARMVELLPDEIDEDPEARDDALIELNVFQYYCMPCSANSDPLGHFYTRTHG